MIPAFVNKAMAGDPLTLAGDGSQSRKFVYVEDLADGVALGLEDVAVNRVYNLASDETVTIRQIAETMQQEMGDVEIVYTPARPGDFGGKVVSSDRAERELGWTAATPFSEGVRRYIAWRLEQSKAHSDDDAAAVIPAGEPDAATLRWAIGSSRRIVHPPKAPVAAIKRSAAMGNERAISSGSVQNRPASTPPGRQAARW